MQVRQWFMAFSDKQVRKQARDLLKSREMEMDSQQGRMEMAEETNEAGGACVRAPATFFESPSDPFDLNSTAAQYSTTEFS